MIAPITLDAKRAGARSAGNPHAACAVAGAGNGITDDPTRARRGKPRIQTRGDLRSPRQSSTLPPRSSTDGEWSGQKEALFQQVQRVLDNLGQDLPWAHARGSRASIPHVKANKSTSVFGIETGNTSDDSQVAIARAAIDAVHAIIGPELERAWQSWWNQSGERFLREHR